MVSAYAIAKKYIFWTIFSIVLLTAVFSFVGLMSRVKARLAAFPDMLNEEIIAYRFLFSCFGDELGVIELDRFTNKTLEQCYRTKSSKEYNFALELVNSGRMIVGKNFYWKEDRKLNFPVIVRNGSDEKVDELIIYIRRPI